MNKFYLKSNPATKAVIGNEHFNITIAVERLCNLPIYVCETAQDKDSIFDCYDLNLYCELEVKEPMYLYDNITELEEENILTTLDKKYYSIYVGKEVIVIMSD